MTIIVITVLSWRSVHDLLEYVQAHTPVHHHVLMKAIAAGSVAGTSPFFKKKGKESR